MNAKTELLHLVSTLNKKLHIKCAVIEMENESYEKEAICLLKVSHTKKELEAFLNELDFEYDDGYGGQNLFGIVWLTDGTWLSRGEYDGSEWWNHNQSPEIPKECL